MLSPLHLSEIQRGQLFASCCHQGQEHSTSEKNAYQKDDVFQLFFMCINKSQLSLLFFFFFDINICEHVHMSALNIMWLIIENKSNCLMNVD